MAGTSPVDRGCAPLKSGPSATTSGLGTRSPGASLTTASARPRRRRKHVLQSQLHVAAVKKRPQQQGGEGGRSDKEATAVVERPWKQQKENREHSDRKASTLLKAGMQKPLERRI